MTEPAAGAVIGPGLDADGPCAIGREWSAPGMAECPEPAPITATIGTRPGEAWRICHTHAISFFQVALTMTDEELYGC